MECISRLFGVCMCIVLFMCVTVAAIWVVLSFADVPVAGGLLPPACCTFLAP